MKASKDSKKPKPIAVRVGNVTVKIYRVMTHGCLSFQVADYSSGKRKLISFADEALARAKANEIAVKLANGQGEALAFSNADVATYNKAIEILRPSGISLEVAATYVAEGIKILGADRFMEAFHSFAKRNGLNCPARTTKEVYAELVDDAKARKLSARYIEDLKGRAGKFAESMNVPIASIESADVRAFLTAKTLAPRSYNNYVGSINRLFEFAKERGYLPKDHDVMSAVGLMKDVDGEIEVFTPEELKRLLKAACGDILPFLAIGAFAGLRSAEVERLEWEEINLDDRFIKVIAGKGKTASRRIVPIVDSLAAWLEPYSKHTGKVWPHTHAYLHELIRKTAAATGNETDEGTGKALKAVQWKHNGLRHSFISYRLAKIQNVAQVALEAGNSPQIIFSNYREVVRPADADKWFEVVPPAKPVETEGATGIGGDVAAVLSEIDEKIAA